MTFDPYVAFCGSAENLARRGFYIRRLAQPIEQPLQRGLRWPTSPNNRPAWTTVDVMLNSPDLLLDITVTASNPD